MKGTIGYGMVLTLLSGIAALMPFSIIVLHAMIAKTTAMTAKGRMERERADFLHPAR